MWVLTDKCRFEYGINKRMNSVSGLFAKAVLIVALAGCSKDQQAPKVDQSLESVMVQSVARVFSPASHQRLTNLPGMFMATVDGAMDGDHWDAHGRRYKPQLILECQKRESRVLLRFSAPIGSTMPLPPRGELRAEIALDGGRSHTKVLERMGAMYRIEGGLPLLRDLLAADRVSLETVTADNLRLSARFDVRGLAKAVAGYDFFCANRWIAAQSPKPRRLSNGETTQAAPVVRPGSGVGLELERLRAEVRGVEGVTSTAWMPDRSLMLGMGNATDRQVEAAVLRACELMRNHPEVRQQIEVHDTHGSTDVVQRFACPR